jgi:tetrahydromethanopterin S-methyltransferase subunit G
VLEETIKELQKYASEETVMSDDDFKAAHKRLQEI